MYPTPEAEAEAKRAPNGYVYAIEGNYSPADTVPPHAIKGAWQVDAEGNIVGAFIPNPNFVEPKHRDCEPLPSQTIRRSESRKSAD